MRSQRRIEYERQWQNENRDKCRAVWRNYVRRKKAAMSPEERAAAKEQKRLYDIEYRRKNWEKRAASKRTPAYRAKHNAREKAKYAAWRLLHPARRVQTPEERKAKALASGLRHRREHPDELKQYYKANRERLLAQKREYYKANKATILKRHAAYQANKRRTDPVFRIVGSCYRRISRLLMGETVKSAKTTELIGCSWAQLMVHLESQFKDGMSWDNYGRNGWHIDHIKPCTAFNLLDPEQQKLCFHYTNLQPLWAVENIRKSNKHCGK